MMFHLNDDDKKEDAIVVRVHGSGLEDISSRERELIFQQVSTSFYFHLPSLQWRHNGHDGVLNH